MLASGCASVMRDAPTQTVAQPGGDKAKVVFMRSSMVAASTNHHNAASEHALARRVPRSAPVSLGIHGFLPKLGVSLGVPH